MKYVSGQIYQDGEFKQGHLGFEDGIIEEMGKGPKKEALAKGIIIPTFVNTHTHIGDSVVQEEIKGTIEEIVAPPDGMKHRILRETPKEAMIEAMRLVTQRMLLSGIGFFTDFREGGIEGVDLFKEALMDSPMGFKVYGRPKGMNYSEDEVEMLLKSTDGIGLSAISDWNSEKITRISEHAKRKEKSF
ncbi:MAG: amidohydrolase family protein, partial [Thermoplasmata archaeon]